MVFKSQGHSAREALDFAPNPHDRLLDDHDAAPAGRSNFAAFLLGGVVVAGGLLAFLYYDSDGLAGRDLLTTGSLSDVQKPGAPPKLQTYSDAPARPTPPAMD